MEAKSEMTMDAWSSKAVRAGWKVREMDSGQFWILEPSGAYWGSDVTRPAAWARLHELNPRLRPTKFSRAAR